MKRLIEEDATEFERLLLSSAELDLAPEGAAERLLDQLDGAPVIPIERAKKKTNVQMWLLLAGVLVGVLVLVLDRKRHQEPIVRDVPTITVPTNVPTPVSSDIPATEMPLPSAASPPPPTVKSVAKRPAPAPSHAPPKDLATMMQEAGQRNDGMPDPGFDRGAAARAIGSVHPQECKVPDGPMGAGHITVTFATDGHVEKVALDGGNFTAGNPTGDCIIGKYSAISVPPFTGTPVRVGKSFVIN